ncbi:MAG: ParA family protein [bacterium]|nr:ParA family protein [bacterium]
MSGGGSVTRRIAFINEKGGSCKTTLASSVGDYLSRVLDKRVLLIDLDPQGQLGKVLGVDVGAARKTALDMLLDAVLGEDTRPGLPIVRARHPNLDLVPSNKSLALFPQEAAEHDGAEYFFLRDALERVTGYDYVLFDSPPSFGSITLNILLAASEVVLPVPLTYLGLDGAAEMTRTVEMVRTRFDHPALQISMVIATFARRTKMAAEILEKLKEHFPKQLSDTVLGYSVLIDEAQSRSKTIFEHAPRSAAARWMAAISEELDSGAPARAFELRK